jgi:hypothetical protein
MVMDGTRDLNAVFTPTLSMPTDAVSLERDGIASVASVQAVEEVWPERGRRDELEALGLLLGVLCILLALAVGLGVTPGF